MLDRTNQRAVAQRLTALDRQGRVKVRCVECGASLNRKSALGQQRPVDLLVEALNNSDGLIVRAVHQDEAALLKSETQAGSADHEDLRALLELLGHDRSNVHRGGHDHVRGRREVHGVKLVGDLLGGAHRVIGDEGRGHA